MRVNSQVVICYVALAAFGLCLGVILLALALGEVDALGGVWSLVGLGAVGLVALVVFLVSLVLTPWGQYVFSGEAFSDIAESRARRKALDRAYFGKESAAEAQARADRLRIADAAARKRKSARKADDAILAGLGYSRADFYDDSYETTVDQWGSIEAVQDRMAEARGTRSSVFI